MKAIKIDTTGSVKIDTKKGFFVWIDVWKENGELLTDWNKYIFHLDDKADTEIKEFQENLDNFDEASSIALSFYEKNQLKIKQ